MAKERLRLYVGSTELNYFSAEITKTNDHIINQGKIVIEKDSNVTSSSVIDFKKSDGSTTIFSAKVWDLREIDMWTIKVLTNGYELMNRRVENVYEDQSPESIVQDVVDNNTENLTFVIGPASGFTITRYVASSYGIDIIKDMMDLLQWQFKVDENDNAFFEPEGNTSTGRTFTHGDNIQLTEWEEGKENMVNHVKIIGGFENFSTNEQSGSTGTTYFLAHKPSGVMQIGSAIPGGSAEVPPGEYKIIAEDSKVILDVSHDYPNFFYSYDRPIVVENQNDSSITDNDEIFKEVPAPFLDTFEDARQYAQNILDVRSVPEVKAKGFEPQLDFDSQVGELVTVIDEVRGKEEQLVIRKITINAEENKTNYEFGTRDFVFFDWQREVQERIKKIERRTLNEDEIIFSRLFKHTGGATASTSTTFEKSSPLDSFILDHTTLGRFRTDFDKEPDCSGSANVGVWSGSSIGSAQFGTAGFRLSRGEFNGTDNEIQVATTVPSVQSVSMAIYPDTDNRDICQLTSTAKISISSSAISTSNLTNATVYVDNVATTSINLNTWNNVVVTFDSLSCNAIKVGHSSSWFSGWLDEFILFDKKITSVERQKIIDKVFYSNDSLYSNCLMWLSMDHAHLGNRISARVTV